MDSNTMNTTILAQLLDKGSVTVEDLVKQAKLPSLSSCLNEMMGKRNRSVEVTAGLADMNKATIHKIMNNKMNPSRDILLRLAFALEMSFNEAQLLLKSGNCAALSASRPRDIFIMEGLSHHKTFDEVNEVLHSHDLADLYGKKLSS